MNRSIKEEHGFNVFCGMNISPLILFKLTTITGQSIPGKKRTIEEMMLVEEPISIGFHIGRQNSFLKSFSAVHSWPRGG